MNRPYDDKHSTSSMKGLAFKGPGKIAWEERPRPTIMQAGDALVRITTTTICGTDLHIFRGDVPTVPVGRILGHEGVGVIEDIGTNVLGFQVGNKVLISSITSCGRCGFCRMGMFSQCLNGGWCLGNTIDGTQAEYVRIPFADTSLSLLSPKADDEAMLRLSCILPTGFECGVRSGGVKPGDVVAIVGSGPVGLAALMMAKLYSPAETLMIDLDDGRLEASRTFGATMILNSSDGEAAKHVMELTHGSGVDVAIEAVGSSTTFDICQAIVAPGGRIANVGVHGSPVQLHLEKLWASNITITTRLLDGSSTPMLLRMVQSGRLDAMRFASHRYHLSEILLAYETFQNAAKRHALKVILKSESTSG